MQKDSESTRPIPSLTPKVIVAGGRDLDDEQLVIRTLEDLYGDYRYVEVVSGGSRGADRHGEAWAAWRDFPVKKFPADWDTHKNAAGPIRNEQMAKYAEVLVAFWDGKSPGTRGMINLALRYGLEVHVYRY